MRAVSVEEAIAMIPDGATVMVGGFMGVGTPDRLLDEKDPIAVDLFARYRNVRMPNLRLSPEEVAALLHYIEEKSRSPVSFRNAAMP